MNLRCGNSGRRTERVKLKQRCERENGAEIYSAAVVSGSLAPLP